MDVEKQVVVIWSATNGFVDDVPVANVRHFEAELLKFLDAGGTQLLSALREKRQIDDGVKGLLTSTLEEFKRRYSAQAKGAAA
jgi:F-type H+-transporting ATPase subunit alpha